MLEIDQRPKQPIWLQKSSLHLFNMKSVYLFFIESYSPVSQAWQLCAHVCLQSEEQSVDIILWLLNLSRKLSHAENRRSDALPATACSLTPGCIPSHSSYWVEGESHLPLDTHRNNRHASLINNERLCTSAFHCKKRGSQILASFLTRFRKA